MHNQEFRFELSAAQQALCLAYRADEEQCLDSLLAASELSPEVLSRIQDTARKLVIAVRKRRLGKNGLDAFLFEYDLSSEEGIALMCLAEALLRIPDTDTIDKLIKDKLTHPDWEQHLGKSKSTFVNAATWALMLTGKVINPRRTNNDSLPSVLQRLTKRSGEPIIREAVAQAMKILGRQFVMGQNIEEALKRAAALEAKGYRYSYDMLGEEALTAEDADNYYRQYMAAIETIGQANVEHSIYNGPGISVKLSALHPRYDWRQKKRVMRELLPKLINLVLTAKQNNIGITIDAEEAERLDLSLDLITALIADPRLDGWNGLGLAVQAYQKRAPYVIDYIIELGRKFQRRIMLRLVKGAYWDAEIKLAQERGLSGYPVYTRKASTDVSYAACVRKIFAATDALYPQFATHNAYTVALVMELAKDYRDYEFQCLHGMGDALYANIVGSDYFSIPCRIYAPVGGHQNLLAYLVRRLLENGANTSFVNRIVDERAPVEDLIADPAYFVRNLSYKPHPRIPLPKNLYGCSRVNSQGIDFTNPLEYDSILNYLDNYRLEDVSPEQMSREQAINALEMACTAVPSWAKTTVDVRIACVQQLAELLEQNRAQLIALLVLEAGKTIIDAVAELREAVDYCRYYSVCTADNFLAQNLQGPTGESNQMKLHARGVIACISPWNFPLAIFLGQIVAALLAGNTVLAKPASQTSRIAKQVIDYMHQSGIPPEVVQLVPVSGAVFSTAIIADPRINGVIFTGSTDTALSINRTLANRDCAIAPFIAETGGQNAMLTDSSVLAEQLVKDVISSAFGSAGQRCSSLRVLYLQHEVADKIIKMLTGAVAELKIGDPLELSTDIGPVIDQVAVDNLRSHVNKMQTEAKLIYQCQLPADLPQRTFFAPCVFEIENIKQLKHEVFGPILHIIRYKAADLEQVITDLNNTGYGLTLGIHSRIAETIDFIIERAKVGNIYVNRNMIGAVVGVQPFGGEGLSGTGPKAGGPRYVARMATERVVSINTVAAGGNASLLSLQE